MSDEEAEYSEEEYEEEAEEVEETPKEEEYKYGYDDEEEEHKGRTERSKSKVDIEVSDKNLSEGEKAMLQAKKRQEEEDKLKLLDYEDRRRIEREQEEEELKKLKEKQEQRRLQREQEDREQAERAQQIEEKRRQEEEERRARMEAERKKKEEEKMKRAQLTGMPFAAPQPGAQGGRNFVIPEKKGTSDRFGNIVQAKQEMGMTKDQIEDAKTSFLAQMKKHMDLSSFQGSELKQKLKELHQRICKLEAEKYDLEKRNERQTYDLKELNERQRQMFRVKLSKQGVDPVDANSRHPPKVRIMSKYDRQTDRRNYSEKRSMFETKVAFPVFPNVPPPPTILEFKVKPEAKKTDDGDYGYGGYDEEEAYEEEE